MNGKLPVAIVKLGFTLVQPLFAEQDLLRLSLALQQDLLLLSEPGDRRLDPGGAFVELRGQLIELVAPLAQ